MYAEVSVRFSRIEELEDALPPDEFRRAPLPWTAAFLAGKAFVAYRTDWPEQSHFWERRGFHKTRDMINYILQLSDMPTRAPRPTVVTLLHHEDVPGLRNQTHDDFTHADMRIYRHRLGALGPCPG